MKVSGDAFYIGFIIDEKPLYLTRVKWIEWSGQEKDNMLESITRAWAECPVGREKSTFHSSLVCLLRFLLIVHTFMISSPSFPPLIFLRLRTCEGLRRRKRY